MSVPEPRLLQPLYTQGQAAWILGEAQQTFQRWTRGYVVRGQEIEPLVQGVTPGRGFTMPFVTLAEAYVVRAFRRAEVSMPEIRKAVRVLRNEMGVDFALASQQLKAHGGLVLWDAVGQASGPRAGSISRVVNGQGVFLEVVADALKNITYDSHFAERIALVVAGTRVIVDPRLNFGQPTIDGTRVRVEDVLSRLHAGEDRFAVAADYGLDRDVVASLTLAA